MTYLLPNGIARIKRLGRGLGVRWYVFYPKGMDCRAGASCKSFMKKAEAIAFVKSLQAGHSTLAYQQGKGGQA
jgi:hypothetical protein